LPGEPQVIKSYFWSAEIILLEDALPTPVLEHPCAPIREMIGPRAITEEIGSAESLYLLRLYRTIGLVDLQSQKPLALLVALVLSLFVFVLATGEARAEELPSPTAQQRAVVGAVDGAVVLNGKAATHPTPVYPAPDYYLPPVETMSVETAKIGTPPAAQPVTPPVVPPPVSSARPAASEPEPAPRGYPGMIPDGEEVAGSEPEPIPTSPKPHNPELVPTPTDWHDPGALPADEPEPTSDGALPTPGPVSGGPVSGGPVPELSPFEPEGSREGSKPLGAASEPTPVPFVLGEGEPTDSAGPSSGPHQAPSFGAEPTSPRVPIGPVGKPAASVADHTVQPAAEPAPYRMPSSAPGQATPYPAAQRMVQQAVQQAVQPLARQALPGSSVLAAAASSAAASSAAVQEALTQTLTTVAGAASAAASAFGTLADWTTGYYYPSDEATQSSSGGGGAPAPPEPLFPPMSPSGDSSFFSLSGVGQAGPGGGLVLLLLGVLASGLILLRRDGPLSWASCELPKPSSALLLPLERPG
jgi:hypothetical protein